MPVKKGTHLTFDDRCEIEEMIKDGCSFRAIARRLSVSPTTISSEVKRNRTIVPPRTPPSSRGSTSSASGMAPFQSLEANPAVEPPVAPQSMQLSFFEIEESGFSFEELSSGNAGDTLSSRAFDPDLNDISRAFELDSIDCRRAVDIVCVRRERAPYVCTNCPHRRVCPLSKARYIASRAQETHEARLTEAHSGITCPLPDLKAMVDKVKRLLAQGQSIQAIWATHAEEFPVCERTFYNYVERGVMGLTNLALPRKVRYAPRAANRQAAFDLFASESAAGIAADVPVDAPVGAPAGGVQPTAFNDTADAGWDVCDPITDAYDDVPFGPIPDIFGSHYDDTTPESPALLSHSAPDDTPAVVKPYAGYRQPPARKSLVGRRYGDWCRLPFTDRLLTVQMDTVEGLRYNRQCILTLHFVRLFFQLYILLPEKSQEAVAAALDDLERICDEGEGASGVFKATFPVLLTDRGTEFADFDLIERGVGGARRTRVFYCDPIKPSQKGAAEKNHVELRKILPKGTDFDRLSPELVALITSHVNSYPRAGTGSIPIVHAKVALPSQLLERLGVREIPPDDVIMTPQLVAAG